MSSTRTGSLRIGVDTGGTFTDVVAVDDGGRVVATHKLLSTPDDPAKAVLAGIDAVRGRQAQPRVVHGSTVATNALLEGKRGRTMLVTTAGFKDLLSLARQDRPDLYAMAPKRPAPPIPPGQSLGVRERLAADGTVIEPLDQQAVDDLLARLEAAKPESVAICLLHSYAGADHERAIAEAVRQQFGEEIHLTVSHELLPEYREYERTATCAINAVVAPRMVRYLQRLSEAVGAERLRIMGSHGGTLPVHTAREAPVRTVLSGPAGGVIGAAAMAHAAGVRGLITLDMGGTSTDVALCLADEPELTHDGEAAGVPVRLQMIDMHTVGAGGGSIAAVDAGGALRVGPASAGADPGPACYGRASERADATVTDAHVVLGHLPAHIRLGGELALDRPAAHAAVARVAQRTGLSVEQTAHGILRVAEATMARAMARISLQRGHDPRPLTLTPFGGAGGLHACRLAEAMGMRRVLLPTHAGLLSAVGMLGAGPRHVFSRTLLIRVEPNGQGRYPDIACEPQVRAALAALEAEADAAIAAEALAADQRVDERSVDLRYAGQSYELTIPLDEPGDVAERFAAEHHRLYGYAANDRPIEIVAVRWQTGGRRQRIDPGQTTQRHEATVGRAEAADADGAVIVSEEEGEQEWRCVRREALAAGEVIEPRTIITEYSATTVVPPPWRGRVDQQGQILLERETAQPARRSRQPQRSEQPAERSAEAPPAGATVQTEQVDAVELEVFKHLFASAAEEMGVRLMRSAYSANIKERRDFSCALFDRHGEMIAQAAHIPVHLGSAPMSVQAVIEQFNPRQVKPGERFIVNDPFAGGTHLPDITLVAPCFVEGESEPRFFVASRAHHADVGGKTPGSLPIGTSIDDEGVRIPPSRLDDALIESICRQTRMPAERRGDLRAQLASLEVGIDRLRSLCQRHGPRRIEHRGEALQAYTARFVRRLIEQMPDGEYRFDDVLDDDGHGREDIAIRCRLSVRGDQAIVDLRESDDQVAGPVNAVRAITLSAVLYVFRCLAPARIPSNSGVLRSVRVLTRPGSIVDARYPAAVAGGNVETSQRIVDVLLGALAEALPKQVAAASAGTMSNVTIGGSHPQPFTYYETIAGGAGAAPPNAGGEGASAIQTHMTNTRNTPIEALEYAYPFRIETYQLRHGSGGNGRCRGGDGVIRRYRFDQPAEVTLLTERRRHAPWGLHGGNSAAPGVNRLIHADGTQKPLPGKITLNVQPGDALEIQTPGGGGWGEPPGTP